MEFVMLRSMPGIVFKVLYEGEFTINVEDAKHNKYYSISKEDIYVYAGTENDVLKKHLAKQRAEREEEVAAANAEKYAKEKAEARAARGKNLKERAAPSHALSAEDTDAINEMAGKLAWHLFPKGAGFGSMAREDARIPIKAALTETISRVGHEALRGLVEEALAEESLAKAGAKGVETLITLMQTVPAGAAGGAGAPPKGGYRRNKGRKTQRRKRSQTQRRKRSQTQRRKRSQTNRRKTNRKY